jgi:hypothetical protein
VTASQLASDLRAIGLVVKVASESRVIPTRPESPSRRALFPTQPALRSTPEKRMQLSMDLVSAWSQATDGREPKRTRQVWPLQRALAL